MRARLPAALLVLLAASLAWVAAPALSLRPYMVGAVDFEQKLPASSRIPEVRPGAASAHAGGAWRWISPAIEAPHEFDLVGIAGELRPIEIRARSDGGQWSPWTVAADGDPVYTGGTDQLQVRAPFRPSGQLHYVNVSGTAGGLGDRLLTEARRAINSAVIAVASTPVAEAIAPKPRFVTRAQWGARMAQGGCPPRTTPAYGKVRAAVIHHTVTANDYTREEAPGIVLGICRYHLYANGWNDIGYQALVDRFGTVYEGRAGGIRKAVVGAQAQGFNAQTTGVASIGTHTRTGPTGKARNASVRYLAWKLARHRAVPATGKTRLISAGGELTQHPAGQVLDVYRVIGHRVLDATACPGRSLYSKVRALRKRIERRIRKYAGIKQKG
jgi:hypothetical protein